MEEGTIFLFDIGATKSRFAISRNGETFDAPVIIPTPPHYHDGITLIRTKAMEMSGGNLSALVGGIAGPLNHDHSMVSNAPNLPDWNGKPLKEDLGLGVPVFLENDTALVGLGEATVGAGKNHSIVAYLTVSTGVNGVRIVDKRIDENYMGFEIGHMILDIDQSTFSGDFESMISGTALKERYHRHAKEIDDQAVWSEVSRLCAYGVHNMICFWSPEVVVIGGAVSQRIDIELVKDNLSKTLKIFDTVPEVKSSTLQSLGGLYGALHYIKSCA